MKFHVNPLIKLHRKNSVYFAFLKTNWMLIFLLTNLCSIYGMIPIFRIKKVAFAFCASPLFKR